ncbi:MAG: glycine oxidase ThiO [Ktedonobacteraceae bacterium]|nr:glycine oxidase ThiO [Ktedonobacteraceae bacterium]
MYKKHSVDVLIIGGGVIGCAIAYFLRKMQRDVTLLERGEIGGEASGAAAGLLAPLGPLSGPGPFADLVLAGLAGLIALLPELEERSGIRVGYEQTGALRIVRNPKRIAHLQKRMASWEPLGLQLHWLNGKEAHQREPLLATDTCAAVYAPEESQIQASSVVRAFAQAAERSGARIYRHQEVSHLTLEGTRVTQVSTVQGETFTCNTLIVASGAWAARCGAWLHTDLPIQPLHGQLISFPQTSPPLKRIIFGEAAYLVPRGSSILVGATKEERGFDQTVTRQGTAWLASTAARLVPALAESKIQAAWAGLRPKTPDNHPILGSLPPWENVLVAAGHNSIGIILSALTGQCIAEMLVAGSPPPLIQPFSIERFLSL